MKLYESVKFTSKIQPIQEKRVINFDFNFDTENLKKETLEVTENETEIILDRLTKQYYDIDKKLDRRIELDLHKIREKVLMNLIPTLFFYKQKGTDITIDFIDEHHKLSVQIKPKDIPNFSKTTFEVKNSDGNVFKFLLNITTSFVY